MNFLFDWGIFLLDALTIVAAILLVVAGIAAIMTKNKGLEKGKLVIKKLNTQFKDIIESLNLELLDKSELKQLRKQAKKAEKSTKKTQHRSKPRLFILDFNGDIKASAVATLRQCITAILLTAHKTDHVLLRLESPGGVVPGYGLAASQLQRLRDAEITLTIAVDKVAASGGYMMACIAHKIIAAPFAIIGSIGVVYQLPNFNRFLKKKAIDFEQVTAGEFKRTLTMFGENSKQDRQKVQHDLDEMQVLFKQHVSSHRPHLNIDQVATGEHWYGQQALELKLVDELQTSDDFVLAARDKYDIFHLEYRIKEKFSKKLAHGISNLYTKLIHYNNHA